MKELCCFGSAQRGQNTSQPSPGLWRQSWWKEHWEKAWNGREIECTQHCTRACLQYGLCSLLRAICRIMDFEGKDKNYATAYNKALGLTIPIALHLEHIALLKLGITLISIYLIIYECSTFSSEHFPYIKREENSFVKILSLHGEPTHVAEHPGTSCDSV